MDASSDSFALKQGNHRSSYNFRSISSERNQFIFSTVKGTEARVGVKEGYKIITWKEYENKIYTLSKPWTELQAFDSITNNGGKIEIEFPVNVNTLYVVGEVIYFEIEGANEYDYLPLTGAFEILSFPTTSSVIIDLSSELFNSTDLDAGSNGGFVEKMSWGEVGEIVVSKENGSLSYAPIYNHPKLYLSFKRYVSREGNTINKENNRVVRWYWTDYATEPKVINVNSRIFRKHYSSGELENDVEYMVVGGSITHDSALYTPRGPNGHIFTATGATYTGTGQIIENYNVDLLSWNPYYQQGDLQMRRSLSGGSVIVGTYSAVYRQYDSEGARTAWSFPTNPIYLGKDPGLKTTQNYHAEEGSTNLENSGQSIEFEILGLDQKWLNVQVAIIKHVSKTVYDNPSIIYDEKVTSENLIVTYSGTTATSFFDLADINQSTRWFKKVMSLDNVRGILFPSNFESGSILSSFKPPQPEIGNVVKHCVTDEVVSNQGAITVTDTSTLNKPIMDSSNMDNPGIFQAFPYPINGHENNATGRHEKGLFENTWYQAAVTMNIGAATAVSYKANQIFQIDDSQIQTVATSVLALACTPLIMIKKHQDITGINNTNEMVIGEVYKVVGGTVLEYIDGSYFEWVGTAITFGAGITVTWTGYKFFLNQGYLDGMNPLVQEKIGTYPRGEKVRIGIVPVDLKGNKLPARWLNDYTFPSVDDSALMIADNSVARNGTYVATLRHLGLKVGTSGSPIDVSDIIDQITGFHIVIAPILRKRKCMGLLYRTNRRSVSNPIRIGAEFWTYNRVDGFRDYYEYLNSGSNQFATDYPSGYDQGKVLFSPDVMLQDEDDLNVVSGDVIQIEKYLNDNQYEEIDESLLKGNWYEDSNTTKISAFFKYQNESASQTSNKTAVGSHLEIIDTYKIGENQTVNFGPSGLYSSIGMVSMPTDVITNQGGDAKPYRSNIDNHLAIYHKSIEFFGLSDDNARDGVLASIITDAEKSYGSVETTQYVSTGHFQPITPLIKTKTLGLFYDIEVFGGQTFLSQYTQRRNKQAPANGITPIVNELDYGGASLIISFPCESKINPYRRTFDFSAKDREEMDPNVPESFLIEPGSKFIGDLIKYSALVDLDYENTLFERSIAYSVTKILGEKFDSWREFLFGNYRTTESQLERIIAVKRVDQFLIIWHEKGLSYFPVNDRAVISDTQGGNVRLGYGGIMEVNIPLSNKEGLQDRKALVETETHFVWLNKRTKNILSIPKKGKPEYLNEKNLLDTFLDDYLKEDDKIRKVDDPYYSEGIVGGFNPKNKEILFSFLRGSRADRTNIFKSRDKFTTLAIDALRLIPTGYYGFVAEDFIWMDSWMYSSLPTPPIAVAETVYSIRDTFYYGSTIYVCLNDDSTTPADLSDLGTDANFASISLFRNFHQHNIGDHCKFYGVIDNPTFTVVFNLPQELFKRFDAHQLRTNNDVDKITWKTDVGLSSTETGGGENRDYSWVNSLPLTSAGARARGNAIEIEYYWDAEGNTILLEGSKADTVIRQVELMFEFINQY